MTAAATTAGGRTGLPVREWLALRAPAEGWLSVGLVLLLSLTVAWSIDDAAWVRGQESLTDFLTWTAALGVLAGLAGTKIGWPRWLAHLTGAIWAGITVPLIVGTVLAPEAASLGEAFRATADSARLAFVDLAILNRAVTSQYGHFLLVLGLFTWATGQYAASAVFRDHRPLDAAVLVGLVLLANMSLTLNDQLPYVVVFTLAALFLLIRSHAFDEQVVWLRRRIGDPSELATFYLRGGTLFVGAAVAGALVLTAVASSNPLGGALIGAQQTLIDFGRSLERFLPVGGISRSGGVSFGTTARITGRWVTNASLAVTIEVQPGEQERFYWRAATYDVFELSAWRASTTERVDIVANAPILAETLDEVTTADGRRPIDFTIHKDGFGGLVVFSPQTPYSVDQASTVVLVDGQFFSSLEVGGDPYTVTALIPLKGDGDPRGLTDSRLRVAGTDYPPEIVQRYLGVPDGAIGPEADQLLDDVLALSPSTAPLDIANTMVEVLQGPRFDYRIDVTGLEPVSDSVVETFAHYRVGYCEYYASTMAILLREAGIPTRLAEGFLPGDRDLGSGVERIYNDGAHAWVEVYFPTYGWVSFDPTGGGRSRLEPLPSGRPVASPSPGASGSGALPEPTIQDNTIGDQEPDDAGLTGGSSSRPGDPGPFIVLALVLALIVAALAVAVWLRGPRGEIQADQVWRSISRLAARFGFGPRPTETAYEYAGSMAALLPDARPALQTVARAKVEVAYGRQLLGADRLRALRLAERRLRIEFLRLAFRRRDRRRPR